MAHQANGRHRVVAGLLRQRGRILLCRRSPQRHWYPDVWDLPGGHVGAQETPAEALSRELWEELGIRVVPPQAEPFAHMRGADFVMDVWLIDGWHGQPSNWAPDEHDALAWVTATEILGLQLSDWRLPALIEEALDPVRGLDHAE